MIRNSLRIALVALAITGACGGSRGGGGQRPASVEFAAGDSLLVAIEVQKDSKVLGGSIGLSGQFPDLTLRVFQPGVDLGLKTGFEQDLYLLSDPVTQAHIDAIAAARASTAETQLGSVVDIMFGSGDMVTSSDGKVRVALARWRPAPDGANVHLVSNLGPAFTMVGEP